MKPQSSSPLLEAKAKRPVSSATVLGHAVLHVFVPWCSFVTLVGVALFWYNAYNFMDSFVVLCCAVLQLGLIAVFNMSRRPWVRQLGGMCMFTFLLGGVASMWNEYEHMVYYRTYDSMNEYTNVQPTVPAVQFLDAGVLAFSGDTYIDTSRGRAFKSFTKPGSTFCVAPVLDSTLTRSDEVGFWAVGSGCCGKKASFYCDDTHDSSTKSAVVLLPPEEVLPPWVISIGLGDNHYGDYMQALRLSAATFGTQLAKDVRLLRWIKDTDSFVQDFRRQAVGFWIESAMVVLALLIASVVYLVANGLAL